MTIQTRWAAALALVMTLSALVVIGGQSMAAGAKKDRLGDPLPKGAVMRLGTLRYRSEFRELSSVAFSPKSSLMANGIRGDNVEVWSTTNGARKLLLKTKNGEAGAVAFSPDGRLLAVGTEGSVELWSMPSGQRVGVMGEMDFDVRALSFDAKGKNLLVAGGSNDIALWSVKNRKLVGMLQGHTADVTAVAFAPKGKGVASVSKDGTLKFWKLSRKGGKVSLSVEAHDGAPVTALAWSPSGKNVITGGNDTLRVWEPRRGTQKLELSGHTGNITAVVAGAKGLASADDEGEVIIWDVVSGAEAHRMKADDPRSLAFSESGGRLAAAGRGLSLWDTTSGTDLLGSLGHRNAARSVAFIGPEGKSLATGGLDNTVFIWETETGHELQILRHTSSTPFVTVSPDGRWLAAGGEGKKVQFWDVPAVKETKSAGPHDKRLLAARFSPAGNVMATSSLDGLVRLWDPVTGKLLRRLTGRGGFARGLAFSPKGRTLATGVHKDWLGGGQGGVVIWHVDTGALMSTIETGESPVIAVAFSPDGDTIATGHSNGVIQTWGATSGQLRQTLTGHSSHIRGLEFSPDGTMIASASTDKTVRLWSVAESKEIKQFKGHKDIVYSVAFNAQGTRLASASADSTVLIWAVDALKKP